MLQPSIKDLMLHIPSRYLLVNVTAQRARAITERAVSERYKLTEKPVKMAINEIASGILVGELKPEYRKKLEG